jgi:hypothetical protein
MTQSKPTRSIKRPKPARYEPVLTADGRAVLMRETPHGRYVRIPLPSSKDKKP